MSCKFSLNNPPVIRVSCHALSKPQPCRLPLIWVNRRAQRNAMTAGAWPPRTAGRTQGFASIISAVGQRLTSCWYSLKTWVNWPFETNISNKKLQHTKLRCWISLFCFVWCESGTTFKSETQVHVYIWFYSKSNDKLQYV